MSVIAPDRYSSLIVGRLDTASQVLANVTGTEQQKYYSQRPADSLYHPLKKSRPVTIYPSTQHVFSQATRDANPQFNDLWVFDYVMKTNRMITAMYLETTLYSLNQSAGGGGAAVEQPRYVDDIGNFMIKKFRVTYNSSPITHDMYGEVLRFNVLNGLEEDHMELAQTDTRGLYSVALRYELAQGDQIVRTDLQVPWSHSKNLSFPSFMFGNKIMRIEIESQEYQYLLQQTITNGRPLSTKPGADDQYIKTLRLVVVEENFPNDAARDFFNSMYLAKHPTPGAGLTPVSKTWKAVRIQNDRHTLVAGAQDYEMELKVFDKTCFIFFAIIRPVATFTPQSYVQNKRDQHERLWREIQLYGAGTSLTGGYIDYNWNKIHVHTMKLPSLPRDGLPYIILYPMSEGEANFTDVAGGMHLKVFNHDMKLQVKFDTNLAVDCYCDIYTLNHGYLELDIGNAVSLQDCNPTFKLTEI